MAAGRRRMLAAGVVLVAVLAACPGPPASVPAVPGADPRRGQELIQTFGCAACHSVPGVRGADSHVGPPLDAWSRRAFIAGRHPNRPDTLVQWIMDPESLSPGTAMPNLGVSEPQARDIAAYLYSLD